MNNEKHVDNQTIPLKELKKLRNKKIVALYRSGFSMDEVAREMQISKTTVFFAVNGRWTKKAAERRRVRKAIKKLKTKN